MTTMLDLAPTRSTTDTGGDELSHIVCCDPDRSNCGLDVSGEDWIDIDSDDDTCVVCIDLEFDPCGDPDCPNNSP